MVDFLSSAETPPEVFSTIAEGDVLAGSIIGVYRPNCAEHGAEYVFGPFKDHPQAIWFLGEFDRAIRAGVKIEFILANREVYVDADPPVN